MSSLGRRQLLRLALLGGASCVAGCTSSAAAPPAPAAPPTSSPLPTPTPNPSPVRPPVPSPSPALPAVARWRPPAGEPLPQVKQVAADVVQDLCTRLPGQRVEEVLGSYGLTEPRHRALGALLEEGRASTGEVVYPQFGGLDPLGGSARSASVMVVVRQRVLSASGRVATVTRTCDVRLARGDDGWRVTDLRSTGGEPVARPAGLSRPAVQVLDSRAVRLPDTARWDVHAGRVSDELLGLLLVAAEVGPLGVTCLRTGHPVDVYATGRTSAHTLGRAADLWMVGGVPVVSRPGVVSGLRRTALADRRTAQLGSPVDVDGRGSRRSFADLVHADHVHLASRR